MPGCSRSCAGTPGATSRQGRSRWTTEALPEQPATDSGLDDRLDVVKALARIAPIHREVLVLYYFDDMPAARMAEALEVAPGTVLSRLARARAALKAALLPPAQPPFPLPEAATTVVPLRKMP